MDFAAWKAVGKEEEVIARLISVVDFGYAC